MAEFNCFNGYALRGMCPYLEFLWSAFSRIRTEYWEIRSISPNSVRMRENADQKNFEYEHFLSSGESLYLCVWPEWVGDFDFYRYKIGFFSRIAMDVLQQILMLTNDKYCFYS